MTAPADNTPVSIINDAYFEAGLIQEGQSCTSETLVRGARKLTGMINLWQTQGLKLWLNVDTAVPLVEDQGTYTFAPAGDVAMVKPLRVIEAYFLDADEIRRPLVCLSWDDYIRLSQVSESGSINSYFVNKEATQLSVFFWLAPDATDATGVGHVLLQTQVTNFTSVTETMNFPIEWRLALMWGLADEVSTGQPDSIVQRCQQKALTYRDALENWDVEDASTSFAPDQRSQYFSSSFR